MIVKLASRLRKLSEKLTSLCSTLTTHSPLEKALINVVDCLTNEEEKDLRACLEDLYWLKEIPLGEYAFEELKKNNPAEKPKVELIALPTHLKYVFLEKDKAKSIVINNDLSSNEEARLIEALKKHKAVVGWHISYLTGISPFYCMHKIMMEDDYRLVRQLQRRLNPSMKEEVWKEVLKLLEAGLNISHFWQCLGESSRSGTQERQDDCGPQWKEWPHPNLNSY